MSYDAAIMIYHGVCRGGVCVCGLCPAKNVRKNPSGNSVLEKCLGECPTRVSSKSVSQDWQVRVSRKSVKSAP